MQLLPRTTSHRPLGALSWHSAQITSGALARRSLRKQPVCNARRSETDFEISAADKASTIAALGLLSPLLLDVQSASAHDVLLQGKTVSLVHPALMFFLFGSTLWTGWLGLQWRCVPLHIVCICIPKQLGR